MNNLQINSRFKRIYEKLHSSVADSDKLKEGHFSNNLTMPQLSEDQANLLGGPITFLDIDIVDIKFFTWVNLLEQIFFFFSWNFQSIENLIKKK